MVRIRRIGLVVATSVVTALIVAAFLAEGIGLAVIVFIGAVIAAALVVPFAVIFEEERALPAIRSARSRHGWRPGS
jgi:hypothetical protein